MKGLLLLLLLAITAANGAIVVKMKNVLHIANETLLCENVFKTYNTTLTYGYKTYCGEATNIRTHKLDHLNLLWIVKLIDVDLNQTVVQEYPLELNNRLTAVSFFPGNQGSVADVNTVNNMILYMVTTMSIEYIIFSLLILFVYFK